MAIRLNGREIIHNMCQTVATAAAAALSNLGSLH